MALVKVKLNTQSDGIHRQQAGLSTAKQTVKKCSYPTVCGLDVPNQDS